MVRSAPQTERYIYQTGNVDARLRALETFLLQLDDASERARIHLHPRQQVLIAPLIGLHGDRTFLDLDALLDQIFDHALVGVAGAGLAHCIVSLVVKQHVSGIPVKKSN